MSAQKRGSSRRLPDWKVNPLNYVERIGKFIAKNGQVRYGTIRVKVGESSTSETPFPELANLAVTTKPVAPLPKKASHY